MWLPFCHLPRGSNHWESFKECLVALRAECWIGRRDFTGCGEQRCATRCEQRSLLPQSSRGIGGGGHGGRAVTTRGICRYVHRRGLRNAGAGVQLKVIFAAGGAVAFARFVVTQASQFIASADAIAVAGFGSGLNGDKRHSKEIVRFRRALRKKEKKEEVTKAKHAEWQGELARPQRRRAGQAPPLHEHGRTGEWRDESRKNPAATWPRVRRRRRAEARQ